MNLRAEPPTDDSGRIGATETADPEPAVRANAQPAQRNHGHGPHPQARPPGTTEITRKPAHLVPHPWRPARPPNHHMAR